MPQPPREVRSASISPAAVAPRIRSSDRRIAIAAVVVNQQVDLARDLVIPVGCGALSLRADVGAVATRAGPGAVQARRRVLHEDILERFVLEEAEVGVWLAASVGQDVEVDDVRWGLVDVGCWGAECLEVAGVC